MQRRDIGGKLEDSATDRKFHSLESQVVSWDRILDQELGGLNSKNSPEGSRRCYFHALGIVKSLIFLS